MPKPIMLIISLIVALIACGAVAAEETTTKDPQIIEQQPIDSQIKQTTTDSQTKQNKDNSGEATTQQQTTNPDPADLEVETAYLDLNMNEISTVTIGTQVYLEIEVENDGPDPANNVKVNVYYPEMAFKYREHATMDLLTGKVIYNDQAYSISEMIWTVGTLQPDHEKILYILVETIKTGTFPLTGEVSSSTPDPDPDENTHTSWLTVVPRTAAEDVSAETVPMQTTGIPIAGLALAMLMILSGLLAQSK